MLHGGTDNTYMEVLEPRVKFIDHMGYEMSTKFIEGYVHIIPQQKRNTKCPSWGTYEEEVRMVHSKLHGKEIKKSVEKKIDSILKESGMTRKEFNEIKCIEPKMKDNGKSKVIVTTPIDVATPSEGVTIAKSSVQVPYAAIVQVQPMRA